MDPLYQCKIKRTVEGTTFDGTVEDIEIGKVSRERLYRIRYSDGDLEHLVAAEVEQSRVKQNDANTGEEAGTARASAKRKPNAQAMEADPQDEGEAAEEE